MNTTWIQSPPSGSSARHFLRERLDAVKGGRYSANRSAHDVYPPSLSIPVDRDWRILPTYHADRRSEDFVSTIFHYWFNRFGTAHRRTQPVAYSHSGQTGRGDPFARKPM